MSDRLSTLRTKIRALRAKTMENGCTEAETLAAAAKVASLMAENDLSETDLEFEEQTIPSKTQGQSYRDRLWPVIGYCTNTYSMVTVGRITEHRVAFIGRAPWPDVAVYLMDVCNAGIDHELKRFKRGRFYRLRRSTKTRRKAVADFTQGMVDRLSRRLIETFAPAQSDTALAEAQQALRERHGVGRPVALRTNKPRYFEAATAGWKAGDGVHLGHGVENGGQEPKRLRGKG